MVVVNLGVVVFFCMMLAIVIMALPNVKNVKVLFDRENTNATKGIAILMIILSHILQYTGEAIPVVGGNKIRAVVGSFGAVGVAIFFFLSGYGIFLLLNKRDKKFLVLQTVILQIIRLVLVFVVSFGVVGIVRLVLIEVFHTTPIAGSKVFHSFITLQMIGTSTWYLKIQIIFYLFAMVSFCIFPLKYRNAVITLFVIGYVVIAKWINLPDFWWKTAMCFPMGALCAENKERLSCFVERNKLLTIISVFIAMILAYLWIMKDGNYIALPQLIAFVCLAFSISFASSILQISNKLLIIIGKASLPFYLIHIGLAEGLFVELKNIDVQVIAFIVLTIIFSIFGYFVDKKIVVFNRKRRMFQNNDLRSV